VGINGDTSYTDAIKRIADRTLSLKDEAVLLIVENIPLSNREMFNPPQFFRPYIWPRDYSPPIGFTQRLCLTTDGLEFPEVQLAAIWTAATRADLILHNAEAGKQYVNIVLWKGQYHAYITDRKLIEIITSRASFYGYSLKLSKLSLLGPEMPVV